MNQKPPDKFSDKTDLDFENSMQLNHDRREAFKRLAEALLEKSIQDSNEKDNSKKR